MNSKSPFFLIFVLATFTCISCQLTPKNPSTQQDQLPMGNAVLRWMSDIINASKKQKSITIPSKLTQIRNVYSLAGENMVTIMSRHARNVDPTIVKKMLAEIQSLYPDSNISEYSWDFHQHPSPEIAQKYWSSVRPFMHLILDKTFQELSVPKNRLDNKPIIHFRCSDVPFVRHPSMRLYKYDYWSWILKNVPKKYNDWYLITDCGHLVPESKLNSWCGACKCYADDLKMFLKEKGVTLTILRGRSVLEDYASFFYAPYLISSGQSSLSFVPGSVGKGSYFTVPMVEETQDTLDVSKNPSSGFINFFPIVEKNILLHSKTDWENCSSVTKKMRQY